MGGRFGRLFRFNNELLIYGFIIDILSILIKLTTGISPEIMLAAI